MIDCKLSSYKFLEKKCKFNQKTGYYDDSLIVLFVNRVAEIPCGLLLVMNLVRITP